jgi:hypothetical protein
MSIESIRKRFKEIEEDLDESNDITIEEYRYMYGIVDSIFSEITNIDRPVIGLSDGGHLVFEFNSKPKLILVVHPQLWVKYGVYSDGKPIEDGMLADINTQHARDTIKLLINKYGLIVC